MALDLLAEKQHKRPSLQHPQQEQQHQELVISVCKIEELESFELHGTPPDDDIVAEHVLYDGWAEQHGLVDGASLVSVNGISVYELTSAKMQEMLKTFPIELKFWMPEEIVLVLNGKDDRNSFKIAGIPPNEIVWAHSVVAGAWAESKGLAEGDTLTRINEIPVREMSSAQMQQLLSEFPAVLIFHGFHGTHEGHDDQRHDQLVVTITGADERGSFELNGSPPDDEVWADNILPGGWAEEQGLLEGDLLSSVNGIPVHELTAVQMQQMLSEFPITLSFAISPEE
eukprot:gnl/MRDRNA2_/MRDRNA2_84018_c0_seq1.p1 gnl/MRDRNA2_/MRDRNA2_84018_c0~~gnl/MRDRNA2_/MRDRNA2_84018_c0_seq1.p1  ORF type:complete len:307 (+),score=71.58 gnl/MRDRNA2_/MRDRNA2_84018_c0_seq1:70-921(+)